MSASLKPKKRQKLLYPTELPSWKGLNFLPDNKGVRKIDTWGDQFRVAKTVELLVYLKYNRHPTIVTILDCHRISSTEYSYDMPLMAKLSDSEAELVSIYSDGESSRRNNRKKINRLKNKHTKLFNFLKRVCSWESYVDLHEGNVMRDRYGNYKLIDIEGFSLHRMLVDDIIKAITKR